jgi:type IV secretion system protein VirD4
VAGYGLRLLPVLQSPAQLRAEYGADLAEEIIANCGVEIAFAPKELKVAQELSERLGAYTYAGRATSRPAGLSSGRRSHTDSDQRRPLMLPQERIQMSPDRLLVLRAGLPPVRGRKIVYWRERAFTRRKVTPPRVPSKPPAIPQTVGALSSQTAADLAMLGRLAAPSRRDDLADLAPVLAAEGLEPLPPQGATPAEIEAWVERFIDDSARLPLGGAAYGR